MGLNVCSCMCVLRSEGGCEPVNVMPSGGLCVWKGMCAGHVLGEAGGSMSSVTRAQALQGEHERVYVAMSVSTEFL